MEKLSKLIKILGYVDYAVSFAALSYGIYCQSLLYTLAGVLGLIVAYLKPAERVKGLISRKLVRKQVGSDNIAPEEAQVTEAANLNLNPSVYSFLPRTRYASATYFVGYAFDYKQNLSGRLHSASPRNLSDLLFIPKRLPALGVRATSIVPRDKR
jgi:hypothetical protein